MKPALLIFALVLTACAPAPDSQHTNLDTEHCEKIALETRKSGKINHNLCPGYMPDGFPVELE